MRCLFSWNCGRLFRQTVNNQIERVGRRTVLAFDGGIGLGKVPIRLVIHQRRLILAIKKLMLLRKTMQA